MVYVTLCATCLVFEKIDPDMIFVTSTTSSACVKLFQLRVKFLIGTILLVSNFKNICVAFGRVGILGKESVNFRRTLVVGCLNWRPLGQSIPRFTQFFG